MILSMTTQRTSERCAGYYELFPARRTVVARLLQAVASRQRVIPVGFDPKALGRMLEMERLNLG